MAFEDALIGSGDDFDPRTATESLIRQTSPEPLPVTLDPRMLNTRLARKLGEPTPAAAPVDLTPEKPPAAEVPDFGAQGVEPPTTPNTLDFSSQAAEPPMIGPQAPVPAPTPNKHWAVTRGFVTGMLKENPEGLAETLEGIGHLAPKDFKESLHGASKEVAGLSKLSPEEYAKKSGSMWDIRSIDDALTWAGETLGSGLASSVPSLAGGTAGAVVGGRVGGKPGAVVGATAGASVPSAVLNYGELYKALKDEKVPPEDAAQYAALAVGPMTALDVASLGPIISRLGGIKEVEAHLARTIAKRIAVETAKGTGREGVTEALQQVIEEATVSLASGKPFWTAETGKKVLEAGVGGAITGGAMGGATGIKSDVVSERGTPAAPGTPPAGAGPGPTGPDTGGPSSPEDIADFVRRARESAPDQTGQGPDTSGPSGPDPASMSEAERMHAYAASRESHGGASETEILKAAGLDPATMDEQERIDAVIRATKPASAQGTATGSEQAQPEAGPQQEGLKPKEEPSHLQYAVLREYGYSDEDIDTMSASQRKREFNDAVAEGIKPGAAMTKHPKRKPKAAETADRHTQSASAPVEPTTESDVGGATIINRESLNKTHLDKDGAVDMRKVADDVVAQVQAALDAGKSVTLYADDKAVPIVKIDRGMMADAKGQRWGTMGIMSPSPNKRNHVEISEKAAPKGDGTRKAPIDITTPEDIQAASAPAERDYTHAQGEANNRQLGHGKWNGLPVRIEVAKGGTRKMQNPKTGEPVEVTHAGAAYGYFPGTVGADKMHVDFYLGDHPESPHVFVIDEIDRDTGKFRQHKVMGGFNTERDAFAAYVQTSTKGPETVGAISSMSVPELKAWLKEGDTTKALKPTSTGPDKTVEAGSRPLTEATGEAPKETPAAEGAQRGRSEPGTPKPAVRFNDEPLSLLQFIASRGGLAPHPELKAIGLAGDHRVQIPGRKGFFGVIRPTGDNLDNMREAAEEAGYLRGEHNKTSTIRDMLDAMDAELRGQPRRAEGEEGKTTKHQRTSLTESSAAARDKAIAEAQADIIAEYGDEMPEGLAEQAATIMVDERLDLDTAVETAAVRTIASDADYDIDPLDITATYGERAYDEVQARQTSEDGGAAAPAQQEQRPGEGEETIEDGEPDAAAREEGGEGEGVIVRPYDYTADRTKPKQIAPLPMELAQFEEITDEWAALFTDPDQRINLETKFKNGPFIPLEEAQKRVDQWRADALAQNEDSETRQANSTKTILSLYDLTGNWARPWAEAGYNVLLFDIQAGHDVNDFSVEYFNENYDIEDVYGILIAQPCTDFAVSGAKHFAAKDARGDTAKSVELTHQSLRTVEYFRPKFWVLENPVSRIEKLTGLPKWRLLFNPNNFGEPYTKKTVLWGKFNADLPTANVEPVEGSKMHKKYGGKSQATKNARSETPEGFAYAFFKANNYADLAPAVRLEMDYPEISGAVKKAVEAGLTEAEIRKVVDYDHGDYEYDKARGKLIAAVKAKQNPPGRRTETGVEVLSQKFGKRSYINLSLVPDEGEWSWSADYEIGGFSGGNAAGTTHKTRDAALREAIDKFSRQVTVSGSAANETHRETSAKMQKWLAGLRPTERTEAGEQTIIPGTEPIGQGEQAQRAADQRLKPSKPQKPADEGLFGDEMDQADLLDLTRKATDDVEAALGPDADKVAPVDIARAAEIMADNPGMPPETAFGQAVVIGAVEQGFITKEQAEEAYGPEVNELLESGQAGAPVRAGDAEQERAAPDEIGAGGGPEAGVVPSGGEAGGQGEAAAPAEGEGAAPAETAGAAAEPAESGAAAGRDEAARDQAGDTAQDLAAASDTDSADVTQRFRNDGAAAFEAGGDRQLPNTISESLKKNPGGWNARKAKAWFDGYDAAKVARRDAPTWATVMAALPKETEGRWAGKPDLAFAAKLMFEISGKPQPSYDDLTDAQKVEMLARLVPAPEKPTLQAGEPDGVQAPVHAGNAPAGPEAVQPAEPVGRAGSVREPEGRGGEQAVPRTDGERAEGAGRVPEGAGSERGNRAGDVGDAGLPEGSADNAADGRARGADRPAADVAFASLPQDMRVLIEQFVSDRDPSRTVPANLPLVTVRVDDLPRVSLDETDRGTDYARKMEGAPPIIIADGQFLDGKHRVFKAREDGTKTLRAIDLSGIADPRAVSDNSMGPIKKPVADVEGENFVIEPGALDEGRGQKAKARDNIKAIETLHRIEAAGRPATAAEQADLARYVGWGGIKNIFPDAQGNFAEDFAELGAKLRGLLSDDEYATARRSIQYAHYTAENVVRSMWDAVVKMGFTGGQVFEPGMGIGNFAGMMPQDVAANSHYQGIELDHVTARIAKLLYPKYGVRQDDFTKTKLPENSYDLVIGNPPFADVPIKSDPKYKQGFLLHDYFFAKSLDAVRPGGLLAFVTSAGTMNKLDPAAREYLADRADLVGAIRLPGDAFKKNAGTEVTTDIIFLRKRLPGDVPGDRSWTETQVIALPGKEGHVTGNVNSYFVQRPSMVLGAEDFNDKLYPGRYSVKSIPGFSLQEGLTRAIGDLPANVMSPWADVNTEQTQHDFDTAEKKEGTYYIGPDGSLHQVTNGVGQKVGQRGKGVENGRTAADMERIKALIPVRDALRQVYAADLKGDTANAERARAALNKAYDAFTAAHGPINKAVIQTRRPNVIQMEAARAEAREEARYAGVPFKEGSFDASKLLDEKTPLSVIARKRAEAREEFAKTNQPFDEGDFDPEEVPDVIIDKRPNVDPFMDDPESYRLRAIEQYDEGTGKGHKSDVFFKNIITREVVPKISSVNDGLLYSLSQYGRVNIPAIAELTKKSESEVIEALGEQVFKVPGTKDAFQTRDEYLSGNVRKKLELAQRAADRNPEFRRNVAALEANQPIPLAPSQIHASLGMPWIPQATIEQFALEEMGLEKARVRYTPALASWEVSGDTDSIAARSTWGTEDRRAPALLMDALNRQTPKIYDKVRDANNRETSVLNADKTQAANDKLMAIREKFSGWIWADQERADTLAAFYNENYNNLVVREYDGNYLTTPGIASDWSWRPHQKRVIARIIQSGNTYVAHAVGAGKTSEYIGAIMEMRRLGLVRKPMVAVPNHMLAQFTKEWYHQYPTARLAIADDKRFHTDRRKQFIANVALDDLDAIIITHSSFGMIPVSAEFENGIIQDEIRRYRETLADLKREGGDSRITRSRIEKQIERLEQRLVSRKGKKDATFTFEEMGVDHLTIDEAHLFRKLDFSTMMSNLKGISPEGSQMAWDLYVKSLYLDTIRPGRGLVLGSGTPITNTMAELYTLSRYMQPQALAERGLERFDAWAGAFGESVSELEQDAAGNYKPVSRFAKFVNVAELSAMVRQVMDVVTSKQLEQYVTRPQIKGGKRQMILAEKSRALVRFQENLAARMVAIQKRKGPPKKGDDIMLSVINDGRHAAIDMRLAGGEQSEVPSKLELAVDNVFRIWEESKRQTFHKVGKDGKYEAKAAMTGPATQLIFTNLGLSGARGFSVPDYIRAELHRRGVPKSEIAYIYDYKSATAKQRLFNDMNEGKVRILIGSVAKMGVGTNVQRRLLAIHNMDPLWYPADDEQRNGRGIRQGNMNPEIGIYDYSTKGTYDSTMWGMMAKKAKFIEGFFEGDPSLRDMDDLGESSQYEQAKALTTNDPRLIRFTELKQELEKAFRRKTAFDSDVYNTRQNRQKAKAQIEHYGQRVENTRKDIKQRIDTRGDAFKGGVYQGKSPQPTTFDKRVDFGSALFDRLAQIEDSGTLKGGIMVAEVGGFPIHATVHKSNLIKDHTNVDVFMVLNGGATREVSFDTSSLGTVRSIEHILGGFESDLVEYQHRLEKAEKFYGDSEAKANAKFQGDADIAALQKQVSDLEAELKADVAPAPAAPVEAAPEEGTELAERGDGYMRSILTPLADEKHTEISQMLTAVVRSIAGDIPKIEFHKGLIPLYAPKGYGNMKPSTVGSAGGYKLGSAVLRLALTNNADQMMMTAFHESYHHVEDRLQTPDERELMKAETPRLREWLKGRTRFTEEQLAGLAGYEIRAIAFSWYANERLANNKDAGKGIHIGVRRWFERLMELLRRIKNGLSGLGFHTYKDVFSDTFEGKVADRPDQGTGGINADELASLADIYGAVSDRINDRFGDAMTEFRVLVQDKFIRVRHAQESVGGVPASQNTYVAESLKQGRTGEQLERLEKDAFDPMVEDMKARGITLAEMGDYLYAKHAPEANRAADAINHPDLNLPGARDLRGRGSGMSDEDAQAIMDGITAAGRLADFEAVEARVRAIVDDTRAYLVETGLLSEEAADAWAAKFDYYVPLRGFADTVMEDELYGRGMGADTRAAASKQRFGRLSKADNPLVYVMMQAELAIVRGEKNRVGNTFFRFVRGNPDRARWEIDPVPTKKAIDPRTGLVTEVPDDSWRYKDDVFITRIGGKPFAIQLKGNDGKQLARALKNMGASNLNLALRLMHNVTTMMARMSTQLNPEFMLTNMTRDVGEAFINLQAQDQQRFVKQFSKHLLPAIKGSFDALRGAPGGTYAQAFREFDADGGRIRFFGLDNHEDVKKNVAAKMRRLEGGLVNGIRGAGEAAMHGMEIVNGSLENATRLAAYMAARDVGMTRPAAAMLALNLTTNFTKRGELGPIINALYMFGGAAIQGQVRVAQALTSKRVRRAVYGLIAANALAAMVASLAGGDDDSGENYYTKIPDYIRDKNIIIMWPKGMGRDGQYVKIPMPLGFAAFGVIGSRLAMAVLGKDKPSVAAWAIFKGILDATNPLGEESSIFGSLYPSVARPGQHIANNRNWNDKPLYPEKEYEKHKPDSEQAFHSASTPARWIARKANELGGGSPYKSSGWLDWHPASIDHVLESITGGLGRFVSGVVKTGYGLWNGEPFDATKTPILRRFVGTSNSPEADQAAFYRDREDARKNSGQAVRDARKDKARGVNKEAAESFLAENGSTRGEQIFKNAATQAKSRYQRLERIESDKSLSDEQRREQVDKVKQEIRAIQNEARKQYRIEKDKRQGASP